MNKFITILIAFFLGWFTSITFNSLAVETQFPYITASNNEVLSPYDHITEDQISIYEDKIIINLENPIFAGFTNTNSMDPVIDETSNAIEIVPKNEEELHTGDIIAYQAGYSGSTIIHRIIETGNDEQGWYAITKGDNNNIIDPRKVRFDDVKYLLVGILY